LSRERARLSTELKCQKMASYTILTEECPQVLVLTYIMDRLGVKEPVYKPRPVFEKSKWTGRFAFTNGPVDLELFTGGGSCVDYIVFKDGVPVLLLESTKGDEDGNPYYQRITKYLAARREYPGVPFVLFYTEKPKLDSNSFKMSMRMCRTIGVSAVIVPGGQDILKNFAAFFSFEEFKNATNSITAKKNTVVVRIHESAPNHYTISSRLSKKDNKNISSDPQVGRVTAMCGTVFELNPKARFTVINHDVDTIGKCESKFWYANGEWDCRLEGFEESSFGKKNANSYYTRGSNTEKVATILFHLLSESERFQCVFANHAGSELEHLKLPNGESIKLKGIRKLPDIVMVDHERKYITILEGKVAANLQKGDEQLETTAPEFFAFMQKNGYRGYKYCKGLIVYGSTNVQTKNRVWFRVLEDGSVC